MQVNLQVTKAERERELRSLEQRTSAQQERMAQREAARRVVSGNTPYGD